VPLVIFVIVALLCMFQAVCFAEDFNQCEKSSKRNLGHLYQTLDAIVAANPELEQSVIGQVEAGDQQYDLKSITYNYSEKAGINVFVSSGMHGDEPAAVRAVVEYLKNINRFLSQYQDLSMVFIPLSNPTGWIYCNRMTLNDVDINREC